MPGGENEGTERGVGDGMDEHQIAQRLRAPHPPVVKEPAEEPHVPVRAMFAREEQCGPDEGERYVLRGGAWNSTAERCRSAARRYESPGFQDACFARDAIGFRCVRRPPAAAKQ